MKLLHQGCKSYYLRVKNLRMRMATNIREFTKPRRRRRGQRGVKNEFIFYLRISRYSKVIYFVYHCQNYHETQCKHSDKYEIKILKFSRRGPRSPDNAEFGHFTLLVCRGRQRNVQRFKTLVHSHCSVRY